ncbi:MAG: TraI domain-containing protein [Magnetococcales bacterium]|nr:TraI domain-containing protein [Magnetococcales bacterium]
MVVTGDGNRNYRYPPDPQTLDAIGNEEILSFHQQILLTIRLNRGFSGAHNEDAFQVMVLEPVRHLIQWVHMLPASQDEYFRGPSGLVRMGLEVGMASFRRLENRVVATGPLETRRDEERLWQQAIFLAGLYAEVLRTLSRVVVIGENGEIWNPVSGPLSDWLASLGVRKYHIRWSGEPDKAKPALVAGKVLQDRQVMELAKGPRDILTSLVAFLLDPSDVESLLGNTVNLARKGVIERDLVADPERYAAPRIGYHPEPWIIAAMRRLVKRQQWRVNYPGGGRVWVGDEGVFLTWPVSGRELIEETVLDINALPRDHEVLADWLVDAGILARNSHGSFVWTIFVPESAEQREVSVVRLTREEILFPEELPSSVGKLLKEEVDAPSVEAIPEISALPEEESNSNPGVEALALLQVMAPFKECILPWEGGSLISCEIFARAGLDSRQTIKVLKTDGVLRLQDGKDTGMVMFKGSQKRCLVVNYDLL